MRVSLHRSRSTSCIAWISLLAAILCGIGHAAAAPAGYSGEAEVASQSEGDRNGALRIALAAVVARISGDASVTERGDVARALANAPKLVLQYQYRRDIASDPATGAPAARLTLVAEFDAAAVERMLAELGLLGAGDGAVVDSTPSRHQIWISGISSARDYARVLGYLAGNPIVRDPQTAQARVDGMLVSLTVVGGLPRLLEIVDGEGTLRVTNATPPLDGIEATLALLP